MKYEDINENTIKITLSFDDLTDYDIKLSDFFGNQEVIEQFFYELVDELGLENRFGNVGMLTFQIQPFPQGVHMIVHEEAMLGEGGEIPDDPEEFEELMTAFYNKLIGEIIDSLNGGFPKLLSLKEQGEFIVGYYQQYQSFFEKNEKNASKEEEEK